MQGTKTPTCSTVLQSLKPDLISVKVPNISISWDKSCGSRTCFTVVKSLEQFHLALYNSSD